jgi:hypothetical protein
VVTAGAFTLLVGGAGPADAATTCAMGHDPATTIKSIECQLKETGDHIQKLIDKLTHKTPAPVKALPKKPAVKAKPVKKAAMRPKAPAALAAPRQTAAGGGAVTVPLSAPGSVRPYSPQITDAATPQLPGLLPEQPQVADQQPDGPITETHLVAPVAQNERQLQTSPLWIAGAAGTASAVAALNLGLAGRRRWLRSG